MTKVKNSDAFKIQRIFMTMTGTWPRRSPTFLYKFCGVVQYLIVVTAVVFLLVCTFVLKDPLQLIQSLSLFAALLNVIIKISIFYFKFPAFLDLLDLLHSSHLTYYNEKYDPILQSIIRFSIVMVKLFFVNGGTTLFTFISHPLFDGQGKRTTPLPFHVNLNTQPFALFVFVYVFQSVALVSAAWTSIGFDNLCTSMMGLCSGYFIILRKTIEEVTNELSLRHGNNPADILASYASCDEMINSQLNKYVEHHLAAIKFAKYIENIFTFVFLGQFLASGAGICLVGFTFMNAAPGSLEFIFALSFLGTMMFQITLYCSYGNAVTVESAKIGDACYMTEWIYCGPAVRKTMFLIMERSKRPLVLTAGSFVNLSLTSLVNVVKSACSYAAVLFQLYRQ